MSLIVLILIDKLFIMSIRNQEIVYADAPRVELYDNFVMYDRFMYFARFDSYCDITTDTPWESDEHERKYFNRNVLNFLVLKFCKRAPVGGDIDENILLLDVKYKHIYWTKLPMYINVYQVDENNYNDFHDREISRIRITENSNVTSYCFGTINGMWCRCGHTNVNGYCNEHQNQASELDDIDMDRLLTLGELINVEDFRSIRDCNFKVQGPQDEENEDNNNQQDNNQQDEDNEDNNQEAFDFQDEWSDVESDYD